MIVVNEKIKIEARTSNWNTALSFIEGCLERIDCSMKLQIQIETAAEEIFVNIASYAYTPGVGSVTLCVEASDSPAWIELTFIDSGVEYDPLKKEDVDITLSAEERPIGGLGIFMVKRLMDELSYERKDNMNILKLKKYLH